jgi:hypothetical protein
MPDIEPIRPIPLHMERGGAWLQLSLRFSLRAVTGAAVLAHLCAASALVAFGWRADGFALNGPAAYVYLALSALCAVIYLITLRRTDAWVEAGHLTLIPWLALVAAGVWFATAVFGATYAPYGAADDAGLYPLVNAAYAVIGCGLALGLHWPRLLLAWMIAHGLVLVLSLGIPILAFGAFAANAAEFAPWVFVPLVYGVAGLVLGWRPTLRTLRRVGWLALAGLFLPLVGVAVQRTGLWPNTTPIVDGWASLLSGVPQVVWFAAFVLPLGWHAWRAHGEWGAGALEQPPGRAVWMAFVGTTLFGASLAGYLLSPARLPHAVDVQVWISSARVVPVDAWLPTLGWSSWLFMAARWLLAPVVLLGLIAIGRVSLRAAVRPATALLWTGLVALIVFALESLTPVRLIANVVMSSSGGPSDEWGLLAALPFVLIMGGLVTARLWERPLSVRGHAYLALLAFALLSLLFGAQAAGVWVYARFLFFPNASWTRVAEYAPVSPARLASLGLALHLIAIAFGVVATWFVLRRPRAEWGLAETFWLALRQAAGVSGAVLLALIAISYALTTPRPTRVVPVPGATQVPLNTLIMIQFPPPTGLDSFLASGFVGGFEAHYIDTGDLIEGTTGVGGNGIIFQPDGQLRPGTLVEATGRWSDKRSYVLRFTTAGQSEPSAMPPPLPTQWPRPVPTGEAPK